MDLHVTNLGTNPLTGESFSVVQISQKCCVKLFYENNKDTEICEYMQISCMFHGAVQNIVQGDISQGPIIQIHLA